MAGSLTIAGSGIASVAHMTLETLSHLKESDVVYYVVADPVTEAFIQANATGPCKDMQGLYDSGKSRYDTYVQMAETMLADVRAGQNVLGIFYGHPGVFVNPSHRALAIAREEGFPAKMLPGVSAEDYMFADLEFDPAVHGCASFEATDLLLRDLPLNTSVNNIIWQVGAVGVTTANGGNGKFQLLVDRLERDFGVDHKIVHYIGSVLPQSETVMDSFTIGDLRKEDVVKQFNPCSTFYVPPLGTSTPVDRSVFEKVLGDVATRGLQQLYPASNWKGEAPTIPAYGEREAAAVAALGGALPESKCPLAATKVMQKAMVDLALSPSLQKKYKADPKAFANGIQGLTDVERAALSLGTPGPIFGAMKQIDGKVTTVEDLQDAAPDASPLIIVLIVTAAA